MVAASKGAPSKLHLCQQARLVAATHSHLCMHTSDANQAAPSPVAHAVIDAQSKLKEQLHTGYNQRLQANAASFCGSLLQTLERQAPEANALLPPQDHSCYVYGTDQPFINHCPTSTRRCWPGCRVSCSASGMLCWQTPLTAAGQTLVNHQHMSMLMLMLWLRSVIRGSSTRAHALPTRLLHHHFSAWHLNICCRTSLLRLATVAHHSCCAPRCCCPPAQAGHPHHHLL
jgi:hypothetical protein